MADSSEEIASGGDPTAAHGARGPAAGDTLRWSLLLVNEDTAAAIVHASSGREEVVLDTVPARDSVRVDVLVAADTLRLRAVDAVGRERGGTGLRFRGGGPIRWEVP